MAKLIIDYGKDHRTALLKIVDGQEGWSQIKRACEDLSDQVQIMGPNTLEMPWWAFLSARNSIRYHIRRHTLSLEISEAAKEFLQKSLDREKAYGKRIHFEELSNEQLTERLRMLGFERELTAEQLRNLKKLLKFPATATFSVPGAGKTTEALAFFTLLKLEGDRVLIISPKNAFSAWEEQINECLPHCQLKIIRLTGGERQILSLVDEVPDISLITYQQIPYVKDIIADFITRFNVFLFLDESHRIKGGMDRVIPKAILSFAHLAYKKLIMSGTPMPNSINDLLPQFSFLYPEIRVDENNVRQQFREIFVRTTKRELGLPEVKRTLVPVQMNEAQRLLYNLLCSEIARQTEKGLTSFDRNQLRSLGRSALTLIQLVSNPSLLAQRTFFLHRDLLKNVLIEGDSPKIQYVTIRARQLARAGQKVIIWSSFVGNVELVARRLYDLGADFIHGGVEAGSEEEEYTREAKVKRFHDDPECYVLVANPAACGEGISLHKVCHHAIYLDRNYNAAQYLQSEDRIHRLGLPRDAEINVEILCCPGTVDESVNNRLNNKVQKMGEALDDDDIRINPIPFDLDDYGLDYDDIANFVDHVRKVTGNQ